MPPHDHAELERFLADPVGWSALHGGRTTPIVPENLSRGSGRGNAGALTTTPCAGSAAPPP
jgi:hypothetical protein